MVARNLIFCYCWNTARVRMARCLEVSFKCGSPAMLSSGAGLMG